MRKCAQCQVDFPDALEFCPRDGMKLPPLPGDTQALYDPLIGATIDGRYVVESLLGEGGMGFVYAARHAIIDKRVAIKVLRREAASDEAAAQRFLVEAKAASKIDHQNIVDITDFGVLPDGHAYFVMEFLDGPTLGKLLAQHGTAGLPPLRAVGIIMQIARGLSAAHQKGIIHRDLKPENIFVLKGDGAIDVIKIVDFGIARDANTKKRLTVAGMVLGTPEYMSPEQATGQETDHRVDMYALGCILYEMLTGDVPFRGETPLKTLTDHVHGQVVPPSQRRADLSISPALEAMVMRALKKRPEERYADLAEMMAALERVEQLLRLEAPPARPEEDPLAELVPPSGGAGVGRAQAVLWIGSGITIALVVGLFLVMRRAPSPAAALPAQSPPASPAPGVPALSRGPSAQPSREAKVAAATVEAKADRRPRSAPADDVELTIRSEPPGAEVFDGDEHLGVAPVRVRRSRGAEPLTLSLRKPGYRDATRQVVPDHDKELEVLLLKAPPSVKAVRRTPTPVPAKKQAEKEAPTPKRVSDLRNPFE
jgi:serine/threonine-protein kinase